MTHGMLNLRLSRAQDEEVGDGTTSVIILAGSPQQVFALTTHVVCVSARELLGVAEPLLEKKLHPTLIVCGTKVSV